MDVLRSTDKPVARNNNTEHNGNMGDNFFLLVIYLDINAIVVKSIIHSIVVIPMLSMVENGSDAVLYVSVSVVFTRKFVKEAANEETKDIGHVISVISPHINAAVAIGMMNILVNKKHVGNLLKRVMVRGNVPICTIKAIREDCHK